MIHLFKTFQDWSFFQCARRLEVSWRQISTWRAPQTVPLDQSLCVCRLPHQSGVPQCRGTYPPDPFILFLIIFSESKWIIHYLWNIFPGKPVLVHMLAHPHVIVCCLWGLCTKALRLFHGGLPGLSHGGLVWIYDANHADPLFFYKKNHQAISKKLKSVPAGTLPSNMLFSIFLD